MSSSFNPSTEVLPTNTTKAVDGSSNSGTITCASVQHNQDNLLYQGIGQVNAGDGKFKKMIGWKTLVEDEEKSLALLIILNENKAHVSDQKKHYDELTCVTFRGQLNSDGKHDGNALFWNYQEWKEKYSNRKMKTLCNRVIDYFADDSKTCQVNELRGLAKKLKEERNTALVERTKRNESKKRLEREAKAGMESIEHALGFRSEGRGVDLNICSTNFSDDELSGIFDGLGELGRATGSHGKLCLYYRHKLKQ
jgi:hypothetical protein